MGLANSLLPDGEYTGYIADTIDEAASVLVEMIKFAYLIIKTSYEMRAYYIAKAHEKALEAKYALFEHLQLPGSYNQLPEIQEAEIAGELEEPKEQNGDLWLGKRTSVPQDKRKSHFYVVGKTGSGKSRALQYWLSQDIEAGNGCAIIDAHGGVIENYLGSLAQEYVDRGLSLSDIENEPLMKKLIIIDPTDPQYAVGINPLSVFKPFDAAGIGRFFEETVKKVWGYSRDELPAMGEILRYTGTTLAENHFTLAEAISLLDIKNRSFRERLVSKINNPAMKDFWENDFYHSKQEYVIAAKRKIRQFTDDDKITHIIGQKSSRLNLRRAMDNGCVILCKIPTPIMGDAGSFLGALIVSKIQQAAWSRQTIPEDQRRSFYLYIDEFQEFVSGAFQKILAEARQYGLHFILAHQYTQQSELDEKIQQAIFGNVRGVVAFDIGYEDAKRLARELFKTTGLVIRDIRRILRFVEVMGFPLEYYEIIPDFLPGDVEERNNIYKFTSLKNREFISFFEGMDKPKLDTTEDVPDFDIKDRKVKKYYDYIKEFCNSYWATPKKDVQWEIDKRRKEIEGKPDYQYLNNNGKNNIPQTKASQNKS